MHSGVQMRYSKNMKEPIRKSVIVSQPVARKIFERKGGNWGTVYERVAVVRHFGAHSIGYKVGIGGYGSPRLRNEGEKSRRQTERPRKDTRKQIWRRLGYHRTVRDAPGIPEPHGTSGISGAEAERISIVDERDVAIARRRR